MAGPAQRSSGSVIQKVKKKKGGKGGAKNDSRLTVVVGGDGLDDAEVFCGDCGDSRATEEKDWPTVISHTGTEISVGFSC